MVKTTYSLKDIDVTGWDFMSFVRLIGEVLVVIENNTITVGIKYYGQAGGGYNTQNYHMTSQTNTLPELITQAPNGAFRVPDIDLILRTTEINNNSYFSYKLTSYAQISYKKNAFENEDKYPSTLLTGEFNLNICPTEGFVFVDTRTGPSKVVFLPAPSSNTDKMIFIKDKYWSAGTNNIKVIAPLGINIDAANTFTIANNGGCLTLISNGENYWIANYYPSNNQPILPSTFFAAVNTNGQNSANASMNTINIYSINKYPTRSQYANRITLPYSRSGAICIIVFAGNGPKDSRVLAIDSGSPQSIDNNPGYNNSSSMPYIYGETDANYKSLGIVFIGDGYTWYIAGWMYGNRWGYGNWDLDNNSQIVDLSNNLGHNTIIAGGVSSTAYYSKRKFFRLPPTISTSTPKLFILKTCAITDGTNVGGTYSTNTGLSGTTTTGAGFNGGEGNQGIYYSGNQAYQCTWIVQDGSTYYPVIGYTPN
jgi:hypothetical protein